MKIPRFLYVVLVCGLILATFVILSFRETLLSPTSVSCSADGNKLVLDQGQEYRFPWQLGWEGKTILLRDAQGQPLEALHPNQICDPDEDVFSWVVQVKINGLGTVREIWVETPL